MFETGKISELTGAYWIPWLESIGYADYDPSVFDIKEAQQKMRMLG